jgi:hypothetical protein
VSIADKIAAIPEMSNYCPIADVPKSMLGEILPNIDRVIFLRADTLVIRNIRPLWIDYRDNSFPFLTVIGEYSVDPENNGGSGNVNYRHSIGCMVANLTIMRERSFFQTIRGILSGGTYTYEADQDEYFRISPIDQAFYQYFIDYAGGVSQLPIRYDAIASSLPSEKDIRSYSASQPSNQVAKKKIEEFRQLTVINLAGMPKCAGFPEITRKWTCPQWIKRQYHKYYLSDVPYPTESKCCDDECCPPTCHCRSDKFCSPFILHKWNYLGTFKILCRGAVEA